MEVLFEQRPKEGYFEGHTSNYINVIVKSDDDIRNKILSVNIKSAENEKAFGEI